MVDPEDVGLGEDRVDPLVERLRRGEVASERLLDDDPRSSGATRGAQVVDYLAKQGRRNREVVERMLSVADLTAQGAESLRVIVGPLDVVQVFGQSAGGGLVREAVDTQARARALTQALEIAGAGHADDRHVHTLVADEPGQGRKDLLEREVTGGPEEHEGVRAGRVHPPTRRMRSSSRRRRLLGRPSPRTTLMPGASSETTGGGVWST